MRNTPEERVLKEKLEAFDRPDNGPEKVASAREIRKDLADIAARAVTEANQRREFLDALANWRNDPTLHVSKPDEIRERHPLVARLLDVVKNVLAELGKEMLFHALFSPAHILLPPTDFVESVFAALTMWKIADDAA